MHPVSTGQPQEPSHKAHEEQAQDHSHCHKHQENQTLREPFTLFEIRSSRL